MCWVDFINSGHLSTPSLEFLICGMALLHKLVFLRKWDSPLQNTVVVPLTWQTTYESLSSLKSPSLLLVGPSNTPPQAATSNEMLGCPQGKAAFRMARHNNATSPPFLYLLRINTSQVMLLSLTRWGQWRARLSLPGGPCVTQAGQIPKHYLPPATLSSITASLPVLSPTILGL